jgi:hypothetical protein
VPQLADISIITRITSGTSGSSGCAVDSDAPRDGPSRGDAYGSMWPRRPLPESVHCPPERFQVDECSFDANGRRLSVS